MTTQLQIKNNNKSWWSYLLYFSIFIFQFSLVQAQYVKPGTIIYENDQLTGTTPQGVVFWVDPSGSKGWMVALNDGNTGSNCKWSPYPYVGTLPYTNNDVNVVVKDTLGYANTGVMRTAYSTGYAANMMDYANGWYLPAIGQLSKLFAVSPEVNTALGLVAGASTISEVYYWSSSAYNNSNAWILDFRNGSVNDNNVDANFRVRAVRAFNLFKTLKSEAVVSEVSTAITNSIVWGNKDQNAAASNFSGSGTVSYSNVEGGVTGTGNIAADPQFMSNTDFSLQAASPSVNTGNSGAVPSDLTTDLAGNSRIAFASVDMGAYEYSCIPISITVQPVGGTLYEGSALELSVTAAGTTPVYQWQKEGVDISGATQANYSVTQTGTYRVIVSNGCTSPGVTSNDAIVTILRNVKILVQPEDAVVCVGDTHTFKIVAEGSNLSYQWYKGNNAIAGANTNEYTVSDALLNDYERYYVKISDRFKTTLNSNLVRLWVAEPLPTNLSFAVYPNPAIVGKSYTVGMSGYIDVTKYTWSYSAAGAAFTPTSGTKDQTQVVFSQPGSGTLSVEMEHVCGNRTATQNIVVKYPTGIDQINSSLIVSPNPTYGIIKIPATQETSQGIRIYSLSGQLMKIYDAREGETEIDLSGYAQGTYLVQYNGKTTKIIKK